VPNEAPSPAAFVQTMLLTATAAPAQYAALMNQSGIVFVGLHGKVVHIMLNLLCSSEFVDARTKEQNTLKTGRRTRSFLLLCCYTRWAMWGPLLAVTLGIVGKGQQELCYQNLPKKLQLAYQSMHIA